MKETLMTDLKSEDAKLAPERRKPEISFEREIQIRGFKKTRRKLEVNITGGVIGMQKEIKAVIKI